MGELQDLRGSCCKHHAHTYDCRYREMLELDYHAPIVPGLSMAGLRIGMHISEFEPAIWNSWFHRSEGDAVATMNWLFLARYKIFSAAVDIDIHTGTIYSIWAVEGYAGKATIDGHPISVGMRVLDIRKANPTLFYNDPEGQLEFAGAPGIALHIHDSDPDPEHLSEAIVTEISVFDTNPAVADRIHGLTSQMKARGKPSND